MRMPGISRSRRCVTKATLCPASRRCCTRWAYWPGKVWWTNRSFIASQKERAFRLPYVGDAAMLAATRPERRRLRRLAGGFSGARGAFGHPQVDRLERVVAAGAARLAVAAWLGNAAGEKRALVDDLEPVGAMRYDPDREAGQRQAAPARAA